MRTKLLSLIAGILIASILSACGGSSSSGQSVSTGVYKDAGIVSGLQYKTASQSGVTDSNGKFKYVPGETVTFSVSNVTIGQATGAPIVTTFDLVGIAPPTSSLGIPTNNPMSKKFLEAVNISLFLQTLDDDSDPTNGIAIPAVVNSVVAVAPLDFKLFTYYNPIQTWNGFQDSPQFKVFIGSCRTAGAWGGTKAIKQTGYAANSLYQGLGITPSVYLEDRKTYNNGESFIKYEYNNAGLKHKELYYNNSNSLVSQTTYTYDTSGNIISRVEADVANPDSTITKTYVYDANGNQTATTQTTPEGTDSSVSEYDINGNMTKRTQYANGTVAWIEVNTYNANGTLATEKYYDANNVLTNSYAYTYNNNLLPTSETWTSGSEQFSTVLEYDNNNNVTKVTDNYPDNYVVVQDYSYDLLGNPITVVRYDDGSLISRYVFTWDSNGYPVTAKFYNLNGELYFSSVSTYDSNGSRISVVITDGGGFTYTKSSTYTGQSGWGDLLRNYWDLFYGSIDPS